MEKNTKKNKQKLVIVRVLQMEILHFRYFQQFTFSTHHSPSIFCPVRHPHIRTFPRTVLISSGRIWQTIWVAFNHNFTLEENSKTITTIF